jgi:hypothetical protein
MQGCATIVRGVTGGPIAVCTECSSGGDWPRDLLRCSSTAGRNSLPVRQPLWWTVERLIAIFAPIPAPQRRPLNVVSDFLGKRFRLAKFALCLEPKLNISSGRLAVFRPDFARPSADLVFVGPGQSTRPLFQFNDQGQNALDGLPIADPPREVAVLICLGKKASDNLLLIHRALSV